MALATLEALENVVNGEGRTRELSMDVCTLPCEKGSILMTPWAKRRRYPNTNAVAVQYPEASPVSVLSNQLKC